MFLFPKNASAKGVSVSGTSKGVIFKNVISLYAILTFIYLVGVYWQYNCSDDAKKTSNKLE